MRKTFVLPIIHVPVDSIVTNAHTYTRTHLYNCKQLFKQYVRQSCVRWSIIKLDANNILRRGVVPHIGPFISLIAPSSFTLSSTGHPSKVYMSAGVRLVTTLKYFAGSVTSEENINNNRTWAVVMKWMHCI